MKNLFILFLLLYCINIYASDCKFLNSKSGYIGLIEFECAEDTSLDDNKLVFYIIGKKVSIKDIDVAQRLISVS